MSKTVILSRLIYSIKNKSYYLAFIHFPESVRHPQERVQTFRNVQLLYDCTSETASRPDRTCNTASAVIDKLFKNWDNERANKWPA